MTIKENTMTTQVTIKMTAGQFNDIREVIKWAAGQSRGLYNTAREDKKPESVWLVHYLRTNQAESLLEKVLS